MKIYEVLMIWSTDDDEGFYSNHYTSFDAALNAFKCDIEEEKTGSWASDAFEDGSVDDKELYNYDYNIIEDGQEHEMYWSIKDLCRSCYSTQLHLKIISIPEKTNFKVRISYKGNDYAFDSGSEAYIFHTGIYNDMDEKYGIEALLEYVQLVESCYIKDDNHTPLGHLADYVAENWKKVKAKPIRKILEDFYWRLT